MKSTTWALKYRPRYLSEVLGQEFPVKIIKGALAQGQRPKTWLLQGPWGAGKCVGRGSVVKTPQGFRLIEDLVPPYSREIYFPPFKVRVDLKDENVGFTYYGGMKSTIKLTVEDGLSLEGTINHPVLVMENLIPRWREMQDLREGDYLVSELTLETWEESPALEIEYDDSLNEDSDFTGPPILNTDVAYLLGIFAKEYTLANNPQVTSKDPETLDRIKSLTQHLLKQTPNIKQAKDPSFTTLSYNKSDSLKKWLVTLYKNDATKVPLQIWRSPFKVQLSYAQGIIDQKEIKLSGEEILLKLNSSSQAEFMEAILQGLGVSYSRIKKNELPALLIRNSSGLSTLIRDPILQKLPNLHESRDLIPHSKKKIKELLQKNPQLETILKENQISIDSTEIDLTRQQYLRLKGVLKPHQIELPSLYPHWFFHKIVSLQRSYAEVFDLNVPTTSSFVANSFKVHNTSIARILAKSLICKNPTPLGECCGLCDQCLALDEEQSANYSEVDSASYGHAEDMRGLIEEARLSPIDAANRVIVLDESHMLTKVAQNVLLKTLEEGVGQTVIILVTTDPDKLLPTIRSRCVRVSLVPVDRLTVVKHLMTITKKEGVEAEEDALKLIVENTYGHIRDALNITQQMSLAGPLTLEVTKKHLNLHLDELVANIILTSGESWTNAVDELNITVQENPPEEIWSSMRRSVVQAALLNLSPVKETLNNIIPQIAETYGPRLLSSSEWVLGEGSRLQIRTLSDLTIALAILREKLGANLKVKVQGVKRLGMPKEKRDHRRKPVHMKPEEMKESLLLIPDDSQQETSTDFTSSAEHF